MFLEATKLIGNSVGDLETQSKIADVEQIIVDLDTGSVSALVLKKTGLLGATKILPISDVESFDINGIVTKSEDNLLDPNEIIKVNKIMNDKSYIIDMHARTESGKGLGKIFDFVFNSETLEIAKFYIKNLVEERILPAKKVVKIEKHEVVFSDDVNKLTKTPKENVVAEESAAA